MNKKTTMTDLRILLREFFKGTSLRGITRKTGLSRTSVTAYRDRLKASGTSAEDALRMDDHSISEILCKDCGHRNQDDDKYEELETMMEGYSKQMRNKYVTYQVIYSDYVIVHF